MADTYRRTMYSPMAGAVRTADAPLSCCATDRPGLLSGRSPACGSPLSSPGDGESEARLRLASRSLRLRALVSVAASCGKFRQHR